MRELRFREVMWFVQSGRTMTPSQVYLHPGPMFLTPVWGVWSCSPIPTVYKSLKCRESACYHCSVQSLNSVWLFAAPQTAACQASLSITNSQGLLKLRSIESVTPSNHLILCCPLLLLPSIFPNVRVFSNESVLPIRWPKCWRFSFNISSSNEYSGLISFRMDWFDLLSVQGTLKSLFQHHSSSINSSVLSFIYCPSLTSIHDYWKNHSLDETDLCWKSSVSAF